MSAPRITVTIGVAEALALVRFATEAAGNKETLAAILLGIGKMDGADGAARILRDTATFMIDLSLQVNALLLPRKPSN